MRVLAVVLGAAGFFAATILRKAIAGLLPEDLLVSNFRGRRIPAAGGFVLALSVLGSGAILALAVSLGAINGLEATAGSEVDAGRSGAGPQSGMLLIVIGFFALGLIDDLTRGSGARGIREHVRALRNGVLTGGMVKAAGGLALGFFVCAFWGLSFGRSILGALVIASCANLLNLLDLRPGRACKFYLLAWAPLAAFALFREPAYLLLSSGLTGAVAAWLPHDLGEKGILGDSGSNLLGGVLGGGIVLVAGSGVQLVVLAAVLVLTVVSEKVSFTRAIARTAPLRWIDMLGRAPE